MPRIAIIGDVHAAYTRLTGSLDLLGPDGYDLAILSGDVGADPPWHFPARESERQGHDASVARVLSGVHETLSCPVVFVPGNHDLRDALPVTGAINIDGASARVCGLTLAGLGGAGPAHFGFPYEWTEEQAEAALATTFDDMNPAADIFLSHTPPVDTALDRIAGGGHVGSEAVARRIRQARPRLFVCGHIHEAWGVDVLDGVPCINAGALGPPSEQVIAWRVTWGQGSAGSSAAQVGPASIEMMRRLADGRVQTLTWGPDDGYCSAT